MSKNDVMLVVKKGRRFFVINRPCNADTEWTNGFCDQWASDDEHRFTYDRGRALCMAHTLQRKEQCEYGVWEVILPQPKKGE